MAGVTNTPIDGTLLKEEGPATIWVFLGGAKFGVPDPATLARLYGTNWHLVHNGALAPFGSTPGNGTLIKEENSPTVWIFFGGARFGVPDPSTLIRLYGGWSAVRTIWDGALGYFGYVPRDATMLKEETRPETYVFFGGARFLIPDPATRDRLYGPAAHGVLWDGALGGFGAIPVQGTLIREESASSVWVICPPGRRFVGALEPFGFLAGNVRVLWGGGLSHIAIDDPALGNHACNPNDDNDACTDAQEVAASPNIGGDRDPLDPWDFYDVSGDGAIDLSDALEILGHFGHGASDDASDNVMDRAILDEAKPWRTSASDDGVDITDALNNLASFGHSCA